MLKQSIWISIFFLISGTILSYLGQKKRSHYFFGFGWIFFGLYWLSLPTNFLEKGDYFNAILVFFSSIFAWSISFLEFRYHEAFSEELSYLGKAAALAALFYFPYNYLSTFHTTFAQKIVAQHTFFILESLNFPVQLNSNVITFTGNSISMIEITYACTGLGSMSFFIGAILSSGDELKKKTKVLAVTLFSIYLINLFRNAFVILATGKKLFENWNILGMTGSFNLAHNFFSKIGAVIVLVLIANYILINLPDLERKILRLIELPKKHVLDKIKIYVRNV